MQLWIPFCEEKSVQLFRVAFFRRDFFQNPYFSGPMQFYEKSQLFETFESCLHIVSLIPIHPINLRQFSLTFGAGIKLYSKLKAINYEQFFLQLFPQRMAWNELSPCTVLHMLQIFFFFEKKTQNGRHKKTEIFNSVKSQYFFAKISWFGTCVCRINWCKGHWYGLTYMVVRLSDVSSKTG